MSEFAEEKYSDEEALGNESTRDKCPIRLLQPPVIMAASLKVSKTRFLSSNSKELCERLKLLPQEKQAENFSQIITEKIIALADKLL